MRVLVACKRGNIAKRDKWGHCLCQDCKAHRAIVQKKNRPTDYQRIWQRNNKDKIKAYTEKWNGQNKAKRDAIVRRWRLANPEKVKAMSSRAGEKWAKNNKGKRNAISAKRRAAIQNRCPFWADKEKVKLVYEEAAILTRETGLPHEVDHIMPLQGKAVSGLHVHNNLQILTRSRNRSKGNKEVQLSACS